MEKMPGIEEAAEPPASPTPPDVLANMETEQVAPTKYSVISRKGVGTTGKRIPLLANHFKVDITVPDAIFYQYSVCQVFLSLEFPLYPRLWLNERFPGYYFFGR